ncbi:glycoside hydrolase family 13 protein [Polychaeton citri CBS 116435]|uniref:Glycoside hydrolase family 13 protein n=1 Tax=Polychaeton citri CBS 116435 TaxID=1314669 RepID=A0A9P4Q186_9PEZI|nr:glycoside hydrolase family 13 protein [Polychaeton citri CBS 116435]
MKLVDAITLATLASLVSAHPSPHSQRHEWWKEATVYQVYPASFKESRGSNATGFGDIKGITSKLDHIQAVGADIVWLSPFYDSPLKDMGYDISKYDSVNQVFGGSIQDIKDFIREVHRRGMRCIFDLVINHTSDEHFWFKQSASSKTNTYRDWYFWRPPQYKNGSIYPPNNWSGNNNGSAWKYDNSTGEYYLNVFNPFQPDLNWDNPVTRQAIFDYALTFWLKLGIDGFRMDAFSIFSKPAGLPSIPASDDGFYNGRPLFNDGPHEHQYLQQMNREALAGYDTFTVGEYGMTTNMSAIQKYVGASRQEVNTVFLTNMCDIGRDGYVPTPWNLTGWRDAINFTQAVGSRAAGDGWNSIYLENHDLPRSITRFANDAPEYRVQSGKLLSMLLTTLSGTLFVYEGQELGMINVPSNWTIDYYRDANSIAYYESVKENGGNLTEAMANLRALARDNSRTPFNWNSTGGFSTNSTTWTPQAYQDTINLADQVGDPNSVYTFWKQMIKLRKKAKGLFVYGEFKFLDLESKAFLVYKKISGGRDAIVVLNFSEEAGIPPVNIPPGAKLIAQTHAHDCSDLTFEAYEGRVYAY